MQGGLSLLGRLFCIMIQLIDYMEEILPIVVVCRAWIERLQILHHLRSKLAKLGYGIGYLLGSPRHIGK